MPNDNRNKVALLIQEAYPLPLEVKDALLAATHDLYNGPFYNEETCNILKDWAEDNLPSTLYVDLDCGDVMDVEPQGYWEQLDPSDFEESEWVDTDPFYVEPSPYCEVGKKEIWCAVFGAVLVNEGGLY